MAESKSISKIFKDNLNHLLIERNVTQKSLADYVGVSTATISHWKKGLKMPRMDKVDKICSFFHIDRHDLLEPKKIQVTATFDTQRVITAEDLSLLEAYHRASDRDKNIVDAVLKPSVTDSAKEEIG